MSTPVTILEVMCPCNPQLQKYIKLYNTNISILVFEKKLCVFKDVAVLHREQYQRKPSFTVFFLVHFTSP